MRVRLKVGLYSFATTIVAVATLYLTLSYALQSQFAQLEHYTSKRDAGRAVEALTSEELRISEIALDYAAWDDSYQFVRHPSQSFIDSNFLHSTLKFDVIAYVNTSGTVVYSMAKNASTDEEFAFPPKVLDMLRDRISRGYFSHSDAVLRGVVDTYAGPVAFAALPITTSDRQSPVGGVIFMGAVLDGSELGRLSDLVRFPLAVIPLKGTDAAVLPAAWRTGANLAGDDMYEQPVADDRMFVYALVRDIDQKPIFALRADLPRLTNVEGQRGLQYLLFALMAMSIVYGALTLVTTDRLVVSPIRRLADAVHAMEESRVVPDQMSFVGDDEIAELARTFARAFGALELTENRLRTDRERLDAILQSLGEAVLVVGKDGNIVLENRMAESLSRYASPELIGQSYKKYFLFYNERDRSEAIDVIGQVLKTGNSTTITTPLAYQRKDGVTIPVACVSAALRDASGFLIGCVLVFRDVQHEREVDRMKSELISIASHQLRTPLTGIKWVLELMLNGHEGRLTKNQRDQLSQIVESNERMIALVEDLLNVSHIETGRKFTFVFHKQDLMKIIRDVVHEQTVIAKAKHVTLQVTDDSPRVCPVVVDLEKIREAIANLVSNAVKYTPTGGDVYVSVTQTAEGETMVHVQDNGIGIPVDQQKRVFERFFRADNAQHTEVNGTGLGLYIAKAIVEGHHGRIWFESKENQGTTFSFLLPSRDLNTTSTETV